MAEMMSSTDSRDAWLRASSYWKPTHITISAWLGHAPFAFWLVDAIRPRSIVELGTHFGFSYFVFCEAAVRLGLDTRAYALDTWQGDDQAGIYGEEVFQSVSATNSAEFSTFSTLLRGYFDDSLAAIPDGSVDLLHIDGRHGYEDVTHDFAAWLPKMSNRGVVIFHDIAEHQEGFGVWQFWEDVSKQYPSFEFEHAHGLGVLGVGPDLPLTMQAFFAASAESPGQVRADYERLGVEIEELADLHDRARQTESLVSTVAAREGVLREVRTELYNARARLLAAEAEVTGLRQQLVALQSSTSWTITRPLRAISARLKS
ncbi:class I SAM-dependent methyltransferase [Cryobacterium sp. TMT1-3]|uniref:class I SAM-dependent methyltransferase n=1 Tax=Cryobacterium sp. TMT1-3 TaxID=1259237 RepID=UPI001F53E3DB|nr:class I SAM-dependent methyltransferase [Cryobacterium sp. TMT1-3]